MPPKTKSVANRPNMDDEYRETSQNLGNFQVTEAFHKFLMALWHVHIIIQE